jgi:hypothetical protein
MTPSPGEVTKLLVDWGNGDKAALDRLTPFVHEELHRLAHRHMRLERPNQERAGELVALDEALTRLAKMDERKSKVVELRCLVA